MCKISIIIPVYNVEKFLNEAVESAINQTFKDIEIILVDDGSTDNSGKMCDEIAKKDKRIKVIHQENRGLSGARNTGLNYAKGKYIMFLDSDDAFEKNSCKYLFEYIEETNADFVTGNYTNTDESGNKWENPVFDKKYKKFKLSITDYDKSFYIMNSGVWNKIFRKSFLDKINIRFEEGLPAEDAIFTTSCFIQSENVYYLPKPVYKYRLRESDSISSNCTQSYFIGINAAYRIIYNNFRESNNLEYYRYFYAKSVNYILYRFIDSDKLDQEERIRILGTMHWFYALSESLKIPTVLKSVRYIMESIVSKDYAQVLRYCEILKQVRKMMTKEMREKMSKPNAETYKELEEYKMDNELLKMKQDLMQDMQKTQMNILSIEDTINEIIEKKKSVARFGDGELDIITGGKIGFQKPNEKLGKKLEEILSQKQDFCLIGVPDVINGFYNLTEESESFWIKNMYKYRKTWLNYLDKDMVYCNANFTRMYIRYKDRSNVGKYFAMLKQIWDKKDVIICEGEMTRMGVGNDLLDNCKSIQRIICPAENAFDKYDEILKSIKEYSKDYLIILALGPTATVLAYELSKDGYQALDFGHLDIEYEWYMRNATKKEKINYKYTNEVSGGRTAQALEDEDYEEQIKTKII